MKYYKFIFVILTYRTGSDIPLFLDSINNNIDASFKVIVVNSYYDEESLKEIELLAKNNDCDFLPIENKGYSYGNNYGIQYALSTYSFDYLVISNSDLVVNEFDESSLPNDGIVGPLITTAKGKKQNPYFAINNKISDWFIYKYYKNSQFVYLLIGQGLNKIIRELFLLLFSVSRINIKKVYALHGSFIIIPQSIIDELVPVFDDNMFLFYEEAYLGKKMNSLGMPCYLTKSISVTHFEDGSTKGSLIDLSPYYKESYLYYFEKYCK